MSSINDNIYSSPGDSSSLSKPTENAKKSKEIEEISSHEMVKAVGQETSVKIARTDIQPSTEKESPQQIETLVSQVQKTKKSKPSVSDARNLPGQRIYHHKRDILPWMKNIYASGELANEYVLNKFKDFVNNHKNLTTTQKEKMLESAAHVVSSSNKALKDSKEAMMNSPELSKDLNTALTPEKAVVASYKEISKSIEKAVNKGVGDCGKNIQEACCKECKDLPNDVKDALALFTKEMTENSKNILGVMKYKIIHEDPMWRPGNVTKRFMAFTSSSSNESVRVVSTFEPSGPAYSSQAPRNRSADKAYVPNFFRTTLEINAQGSDKAKKMIDVTRSAITVEFDQPDKNERAKCNEQLVHQVVKTQVHHFIEKVDPYDLEKAENPETPITFKGQTINLLTPDVLRSLTREHEIARTIGQTLSKSISGAPADDERALALENMEAHQALNGKTFPYKITDDEGKEKTIYVKYDLRYFNIPNNTIYAKMPSLLTDSKDLTSSNNASWEKLETDAKKQMDDLKFQSESLYGGKIFDLLSTNRFDEGALKEHAKLIDLNNRITENIKQRELIVARTVTTGMKNDEDFNKWQKQADSLAAELKLLEKQEGWSVTFQGSLELIKQRKQLADLFLDTKELFKSGLSKNLSNMDNNRSALATRIIALGALLDDTEVHFGCRSGKDRTGLVDIELKLLFTEGDLLGRIPSYREEERIEDIVDHRETMTMESGNVFDVVKAVMGASVGMNTHGSASEPLERNEKGQQYNEFTEGAQAFAKMASRPPTSWNVESAYVEEYAKVL